MMSKKTIFTLLIFPFAMHLFAQTENTLTNSPYTLYGLGLTNDLSTGITNALGKSGIAMQSNKAINNLNPASLGGIFSNSFFSFQPEGFTSVCGTHNFNLLFFR